MKISIVIVNYNVKYYLDQCLRSVVKAIQVMQAESATDAATEADAAMGDDASDWGAEVIVVDNHSSDGSVEYLSNRYPRERYPMIRIVSSMHNLGFARANNIAIRQSTGKYVLLLNPDTIVGEHVLLDSIRLLDSHADAGALGVKMLNARGVKAMESRRGLPTPLVAFYKMMGFCNRWPEHRVFGRYYMGYLPWNEVCQIEVVSGAYCMMRREAIDKVGLLDEDFFMYGEDIDLSYRILKGGFHNYYLPVSILHYKGESTVKSSFRYVHVFYEAMLIFFRKHYSSMSFLLSVPIKAAIYAKASVALVRMVSERIRKSLGFFTPRKEVSRIYLFVGSPSMLSDCRVIAHNRGLEANYVETEQFTPSRMQCADIVVFDADVMDYEQMLKIMEQGNGGKNRVSMGTYCRAIGKVITDDEILDGDIC